MQANHCQEKNKQLKRLIRFGHRPRGGINVGGTPSDFADQKRFLHLARGGVTYHVTLSFAHVYACTSA